MATTKKELLEKLQIEFFKKLEQKTSWGRKEVKELYLTTKNEVLLAEVDKQ